MTCSTNVRGPLPAGARTLRQSLPEAGRLLSAAVVRRRVVTQAAKPPGAATPTRVGRPAAVLVLLGPTGGADASGDDAAVVLLERADGLRSHPGQVAFPGGSLDAGDGGDVVAAALREAREEVGAPGTAVIVLGCLPSVPVPPRPVPVTPVVAWEDHPGPLAPGDPGEVASALRVPLRALADPDRRHSVRAGSGWVGPAFRVGDLTVWGFTALVLDCLLSASGLARPWDAERVVELPARFGGGPR